MTNILENNVVWKVSFPWFFHFPSLVSIHIKNKQHTAEVGDIQLISELQLYFRTIWSSSAIYQWQDSIPRDSGSVALGWGPGSDSFPSSPKWLIKCSGLRIIEHGIRWHEWWSILFPRSEVAENLVIVENLAPGVTSFQWQHADVISFFIFLIMTYLVFEVGGYLGSMGHNTQLRMWRWLS